LKPKSAILQLTLTIVFAALVAATTLMVRIPIPATTGYFNIGDAMIFVAALVFGPVVGGLAGGCGSAIADIIGYPLFAPYTLVIKGMEGWIAGKITRRTAIQLVPSSRRNCDRSRDRHAAQEKAALSAVSAIGPSKSGPQLICTEQWEILLSTISPDKDSSCSIREHLSYHCCTNSLSPQPGNDCRSAFFFGNY